MNSRPAWDTLEHTISTKEGRTEEKEEGREEGAMESYSNPAVPHSSSGQKSGVCVLQSQCLSLASQFHFVVLYTPTEGD